MIRINRLLVEALIVIQLHYMSLLLLHVYLNTSTGSKVIKPYLI